MTQEKTGGLQEALHSLANGKHEVLADPAIAKVLPATINRLIDNQKIPAVDALLSQLSTAARTVDKELRKTASGCLVESAKLLAKANHADRLIKIQAGLKTIADSPVYSDELRADAKAILSRLNPEQSGAKEPETGKEGKPKDPVSIREEQIFRLAETGNTEVAKQQLYDLVVSCARKKDFANAERLRDRIYEIDPMALMEIIQSGEIIDHEKSDSISDDDLEIWARLRRSLTNDEFNALYYAMEERTFKSEQNIVSQGMANDELFFISMGSVRVSYFGGEKELFLKNLESGEIAGENFFNASVWTVSLTALQLTRIMVLKRTVLAQVEERHPGIESKLRDYYERTSDLNKMIKAKGMERRAHKRFKLERRIQLQVVDKKDRILSSFRGETSDVSRGGFSFVVRITKKENSRLLLGRTIRAGIPVPGLPDKLLRGTVIGVQAFDRILSDYSVHVKFLKELDDHNLKILLGE